MSALTSFLDILFPPRCIFCRRFLKSGQRMQVRGIRLLVKVVGVEVVCMMLLLYLLIIHI